MTVTPIKLIKKTQMDGMESEHKLNENSSVKMSRNI